jgi:two-component system LytT family sensor kinase
MILNRQIWWLMPLCTVIGGLFVACLLRGFTDLWTMESLKVGLSFTSILLLAFSQGIWIIRAYPTKVGLPAYAIAAGLVFGIIAGYLHSYLEMLIFLPPHEARYDSWLSISPALRYTVYPALLIIFCLVVAMIREKAETVRRFNQQQDAATLLRDAELFKLRQQLQPHFLFNSLNAISSLTIMAPDKAAEMVSRLADFLRTAVRQGQRDYVSFAEELSYLESYLRIEAVRFGDRLHIDWSIDENLEQLRIPPFLLQPLVENAIRYGVYGRTGEVRIAVRAATENGLLSIVIENPFDPAMTPSKGTGFGLTGVRRRLYLLFARQDLLRTESANEVFHTHILIPQT